MVNENNKWSNIIIGTFIIIAIVTLIILVLPLANLTIENNEIGIIKIEGTITSKNISKIHTSPEIIEKGIEEANNNPNVKAIILEINSKGGSLTACEELSDKIKNSNKTTIAYIHENGLSEAYLLASSTDYVVAQSSSTIGGLGLSFSNSKKYSKTEVTAEYKEKYANLSKNKINKNNNSIKSNNSELTSAQEMINQDYTQFIELIADNRNLTGKYVSELAYGKKYNGNEAKKLKLIDKVENKNKLIKSISKKLNLTEYKIVEYPKTSQSLTEKLSEKLNISRK